MGSFYGGFSVCLYVTIRGFGVVSTFIISVVVGLGMRTFSL